MTQTNSSAKHLPSHLMRIVIIISVAIGCCQALVVASCNQEFPRDNPGKKSRKS